MQKDLPKTYKRGQFYLAVATDCLRLAFSKGWPPRLAMSWRNEVKDVSKSLSGMDAIGERVNSQPPPSGDLVCRLVHEAIGSPPHISIGHRGTNKSVGVLAYDRRGCVIASAMKGGTSYATILAVAHRLRENIDDRCSTCVSCDGSGSAPGFVFDGHTECRECRGAGVIRRLSIPDA